LYWGVRTAADLYEHDWLSARARERPGFAYRPVLSAPGVAAAGWTGRAGLVHEAVLADYPDLGGYDVYASGPPAMVEAIRAVYPAHGLPREQLFFDSFDYAPDTLAKIQASQG
jgi:CDP-4-dehydro-6-deoxyglucose reductase